jgi:hypothetical protein
MNVMTEKNTGTDTCLTQSLPPQPKRLRRELFFPHNLGVWGKVAIFVASKHHRGQTSVKDINVRQ